MSLGSNRNVRQSRRGQRQVQRPCKVPDCQFVVGERVHEREPDRVCEQLEDLGGLREDVRGGKAVPSRPDFFGADGFGQRQFLVGCLS